MITHKVSTRKLRNLALIFECTKVIVFYFLSVKSESTKTKFDKNRERSTPVPANSSAKVKGIYSDEDSTEDHEDNTGLEDG